MTLAEFAAEALPAPIPPPKLPYRLEALVWDAQHHFNQQNRYGYNGKTWRKYCDPMLMCEMCDQWFACHEVTCMPQGAQFVPFQRNYRFTCRVCGAGQEHFEVLTNTWSSIALTAMYSPAALTRTRTRTLTLALALALTLTSTLP